MIKNDKDLALIAIKQDSFAFSSLLPKFKNDKEIVQIALKNGYKIR